MFKAPLIDDDSQRSTISKIFKVSIAFIGGCCLALLGFKTTSSSSPELYNTSLMAMPTSQMTLRSLPAGAGPWKELALAAIESNNRCGRDTSIHSNGVKAVLASLSSKDRAMVARAEAKVVESAEKVLQAGQVAPLGFWDPQGLSTGISEGRLLFFREAEIKHGRVCMLAFLGMLVGENYHPLFGGNIDIPAANHFAFGGYKVGEGAPGIFWAAAYLQFIGASYLVEKATSVPTMEGKFISGLNPNDNPETFAVKGGRVPGDLGFDPLGLKPKKESELLQLQNKELLNGRLAMIAVIGVLTQEWWTGQKVFR